MSLSPMNDFINRLTEAGLSMHEGQPIADGQLHRYRVNDDKSGSRNGWYVLHMDDKPFGAFGSWKTGQSLTWTPGNKQAMNEAERQAYTRRIEVTKQIQDKEQAIVHTEAAQRAQHLWEKSAKIGNHPYLTQKKIKPYGLRYIRNQLVIPLYDQNGNINSLQFINGNGQKTFLTGGKKRGGYFPIGKPDGTLCICEGYATGASIHESTGQAVAIAFDAGNLLSVAQALHEKYPDLCLILCADDDYQTEGNPGISKATEAALSVNGLLAVPDFGNDRPEKATDFNDLFQLKGIEVVRSSLEKARSIEQNVLTDDTDESLSDLVKRLATLSPLEYEQVREDEARRLGVRVKTLDKEVLNRQKAAREEAGQNDLFPIISPWPVPVDGSALLDEICQTIKRFIVCEAETAIAASLWIAFTWLIDSVQVAPLAIITAPEKRCGKTQLLNLISSLSYRPLIASNISAAAVYRVIETYSPTLLIDEADSFMKENEDLRGIINSGHTRQSAYTLRCVGDDHETKQFSTWGAKAISGIGHLSDTLMDRAVILSLRRKLPNETVTRLRHAEHGLFDTLNAKLARFAHDAAASIARARPILPEELNDRAQDNWEPLLAIADLVGGNWPQLARQAAIKISDSCNDPKSISNELLSDIQEIIEAKKAIRFSLIDLTNWLCEDQEKPWASYNRGKPITTRQVSKRLKDYGLNTKPIRNGYDVSKGYEATDFEEILARYVGEDTPQNSGYTVTKTVKPTDTNASSVTKGKNALVTSGYKLHFYPQDTPEELTGKGEIYEATL